MAARTHALVKAPRAAQTSIRVSLKTRDTLAERATEQGLSLGAFLDRVAEEERRKAMFAAHRKAYLEALEDPEFRQEVIDWAESDDDGWSDNDEFWGEETTNA